MVVNSIITQKQRDSRRGSAVPFLDQALDLVFQSLYPVVVCGFFPCRFLQNAVSFLTRTALGIFQCGMRSAELLNGLRIADFGMVFRFQHNTLQRVKAAALLWKQLDYAVFTKN
jgi:hypothetical protein